MKDNQRRAMFAKIKAGDIYRNKQGIQYVAMPDKAGKANWFVGKRLTDMRVFTKSELQEKGFRKVGEDKIMKSFKKNLVKKSW